MTYFMTPKVTVTFVVGLTQFMTPRGYGLTKGQLNQLKKNLKIKKNKRRNKKKIKKNKKIKIKKFKKNK